MKQTKLWKMHWVTLAVLLALPLSNEAQFATRNKRWPLRGPGMWAVPRELPQLYREFDGIDFGHAHLDELGVALGQAAGGDQSAAATVFFHEGHIGQGAEAFLDGGA